MMSSKQREIAIKTIVDDGVPQTRDAIVVKIFDLYRRSHHFSLRKSKPELYAHFLEKIKEYHLLICKESFSIYSKARNKTDDKIPHPNYFLAVCKRLKDKQPDKNINTVWGKSI